MEKDLDIKLKGIHEDVVKTGQDVVFRVFPKKILELQQIIKAMDDPGSPFSLASLTADTDTTVYQAPPSDDDMTQVDGKVNDVKYARYPTVVNANARVHKMHEVVLQQTEEMLVLVEQVEVWIILTTPKIEDGDNFGVQVQEKVLDQLLNADRSATSFRTSALDYHIARAKICSKLIKYPNIKDYAFALQEHDKRQIYSARERLRELRNMYAVMVDVVQKNIEKIREPKANNGGFYAS